MLIVIFVSLQLVVNGVFKAQLSNTPNIPGGPAPLIEMLEFTTTNHKEYVSRNMVNEQVKQGSPEMMKMSPGNQPQGGQNSPSISEHITDAYGVPSMVLSLLEVG